LGGALGREALRPVGNGEIGAHRQRIAMPLTRLRARLAADDHAGLEPPVRIFDYDLASQTGDLVELLAHGHVLDDVLVFDPSGELGEDRVGERVPLDEHRARLDLLVQLDLDLGAVHDGVALALPPALVHDADLAVTVGGHQVPIAVLHCTQVVVADGARALRFVLGGLDDAAGRSSDVEGAHGELRSGFSDGLSGDDADRLAQLGRAAGRGQLGQAAGAEVAAVAHDAHAALRLADECGPDTDTLDTGVLDLLGQLLGDLAVDLRDDLVRQRIADVLGGHAADDAVAQRLDDVTALDERRGLDVLHGAAVVLADDHVLGHVDQAPRQIAGVGRL